MPIALRGGSETEDPRLDRVVHFDERSRDYPITAAIPEQLTAKSWVCKPRLDQGREGACVGFGWAHELAASPATVKTLNGAPIDERFARERLYWEAQKIDPYPGGSYPGATPRSEGSSVLAGAKVVQALGLIDEYRWAFGIDDLLLALAHAGPAVLGTNWLTGMFHPRPSGLLEVTGTVAGGHCWLARGVILRPRLTGERIDEPVIRARNSWGPDWGTDGDFFVRASQLEALLQDDGEACVPMGRRAKPATA